MLIVHCGVLPMSEAVPSIGSSTQVRHCAAPSKCSGANSSLHKRRIVVTGTQKSRVPAGVSTLEFFLADANEAVNGEGKSFLGSSTSQQTGTFDFALGPIDPPAAVTRWPGERGGACRCHRP